MKLKHIRTEWDELQQSYYHLYRDNSNVHFITSLRRWDDEEIEDKLNTEKYEEIDYIANLDLRFFDTSHTPYKSMSELELCFTEADYETFTELFFLINFPFDNDEYDYDYSDRTTVLFQEVFSNSPQSIIEEATEAEIEELLNNKQTLFIINQTDNGIITVYFLIFNKEYNRIDKRKFAFTEEYMRTIFNVKTHPVKYDILDLLSPDVITKHFYYHFINYAYNYNDDLERVKSKYVKEYLLKEIEKLEA